MPTNPTNMQAFIDAEALSSLLPFPELIPALHAGFSAHPGQPDRVHLTVPSGRESPSTLLLMPAWNDRYIGVKVATIHPHNGEKGLPSVHASYVLKDAETGQDLAVLDGTALTRLRTAAASALASTFLSRRDASTLLMVGAGALAVPLIRAHASVRPIHRVLAWNRTPDRTADLQKAVDLPVTPIDDLSTGVAEADIISCATLSLGPLIRSHDVGDGTHIDLVGAYRPDMRESDSALIGRARVFVDTYPGARHEAGDLVQAASEGDWSFELIEADLADLCSGKHPGRHGPEEVTVFKSVGASIEDLIAAGLAWERYNG